MQYELPAYMSFLTEDECQFNPTPLLPEFDIAATSLWDSGYKPLLNLMLNMFWSRTEERNGYQHPPPTTTFAQSFLRKHLDLHEHDLQVIEMIILQSTKTEKGQRHCFFDREDGREATNENEVLYPKLETWLEGANTSTENRGEKRENQMADDTRVNKKAKHA